MIRDPATLNLLLDGVRRFVREELVPAEKRGDDTDEIPAAMVDGMKQLGLFGMTIPEEFGGLALTMEEGVWVVFELTQTSPAFRSLVGTTVGIGSQGLVWDGTPAQKQAWLPKMATGEVIASFCLTEPEAPAGPGTDRLIHPRAFFFISVAHKNNELDQANRHTLVARDQLWGVNLGNTAATAAIGFKPPSEDSFS